jgi:hypothetical protein
VGGGGAVGAGRRRGGGDERQGQDGSGNDGAQASTHEFLLSES